MGENPQRDWTAAEARDSIAPGWPTGSVDEVEMAMERMARWHMIWDGNGGYRIAPPADSEA
jgi:hypothetical protein